MMADFLPSDFDRDLFYPSFFRQFEQFVNTGNNQGLTIYEENNQVIVEAAMPGLTPDDIEVGINNDWLWIHGKKKQEEDNKEKKYFRKSDRSFSYNVLLDHKIDTAIDPKATYKDGILKILLTKAKMPEKRKITIHVEK